MYLRLCAIIKQYFNIQALNNSQTYPNIILPSRKRGNIAAPPLKYRPTANTDVPAKHIKENSKAPTKT